MADATESESDSASDMNSDSHPFIIMTDSVWPAAAPSSCKKPITMRKNQNEIETGEPRHTRLTRERMTDDESEKFLMVANAN